jgi:hypothetical protein
MPGIELKRKKTRSVQNRFEMAKNRLILQFQPAKADETRAKELTLCEMRNSQL